MTDDRPAHRIRLRGPWQFTWRNREDQSPDSCGTMQHPDDWRRIVGSRSGVLELTRRFHAPTNLDADETVCLLLTGVFGSGDVRLNNEEIGRFVRNRGKCSPTRRGDAGSEASSLEVQCDEVGQITLVFDDEDGLAGGHCGDPFLPMFCPIHALETVYLDAEQSSRASIAGTFGLC